MIDSQIVVISILRKKICVETETCETCHSKPGFSWVLVDLTKARELRMGPDPMVPVSENPSLP